MRLILLITAMAVTCATAAFAQPGVNLSYTNCDMTLSVNSAPDCGQDPATPSPALILSFEVAAPVADFVGVQGAIEIGVAPGDPVPQWWNAGAGECREGLITSVNVTTLAQCTNPYAGTPGQGGGLSFSPGPDASRQRIEYAWARGGDTSALAAGTRYSAVRINISGETSSACTGCATPASIVISYMEVAGQLSGSTFLTTPSVRGHVFHQGGVGIIPTAKKSWGAIKSQYR